MTGPARRPCNTLVDTRHGPFLVNRHDLYVAGSLLHYGEYVPDELALLRSLVPVHGVVIDCGAHIGALTIPLAQHVGPRGLVVAYEPQRLCFQLLCANVALHSLTNVYTYHAAVGAERDTIRVPTLDPTVPNNTGGLSLVPPPEHGDHVPVHPLDLHQLARLALIKADVEGMERDVLTGAATLIATHRPFLYLECNDREGPERAALLAHLRSLRYRAYDHWPTLYDPDNWAGEVRNYYPNTVSLNVLGVPEERIDAGMVLPAHLMEAIG